MAAYPYNIYNFYLYGPPINPMFSKTGEKNGPTL